MATKKIRGHQTTLKWHKLDNTANLFPVIVSETVSNVYRISVTLKEDIDPELLQKAELSEEERQLAESVIQELKGEQQHEFE